MKGRIIPSKITKKLLDNVENLIHKPKEVGFFRRVWNTESDIYLNRIKSIGMSGLERVLDAGCGYGQWTFPLAQMNKFVLGVDVEENRVDVASKLFQSLRVKNAIFEQGDIEKLDLYEEGFDGIFCYSALYFTDYRKTLKRFHNLLKPGAHLYFSTNDIGWYFYNILNEHNSTADFSSSEMGMDAIDNSIKYFSGSRYDKGKMIVMPKEQVMQELVNIGFIIKQIGGDGKIDVSGTGGGVSFYDEFYSGFQMVYEVLCQKI